MPAPLKIFARLVDHFKHAGGGGESILHLRYDVGHFVEGLRILVGITQKYGKHADRKAAERHRSEDEFPARTQAKYAEHGAQYADERVNDRVDKAGTGVGKGGIELRTPADLI